MIEPVLQQEGAPGTTRDDLQPGSDGGADAAPPVDSEPGESPITYKIGDRVLTPQEVQDCIDHNCNKCNGSGRFIIGQKPVPCRCLTRELALRYGTPEDRKRAGVRTDDERLQAEMARREQWTERKREALQAEVDKAEDVLEALTRTYEIEVETFDQCAQHADQMAAAVKASLERDERTVIEAAEQIGALAQKIEELRQAAKSIADRCADARSTVGELALEAKAHRRRADAVKAEHAPGIDAARKRLDKCRRRLEQHGARHA